MKPRPIEILLVEDSPGDIWLTRETLLQGPVPKNIRVVTNGEQALDYLRKKGPFAEAVRPDLVLLDLNLPRRDGFEVLRAIKQDPEMCTITVIVLTTSGAPLDVNTAYELNANCYVVKPVNLEDFTRTIRAIEDFWMRLASLPTRGPVIHSNKERAESAAGGPASHSHRPMYRASVGQTVLLSAPHQNQRGNR